MKHINANTSMHTHSIVGLSDKPDLGTVVSCMIWVIFVIGCSVNIIEFLQLDNAAHQVMRD